MPTMQTDWGPPPPLPPPDLPNYWDAFIEYAAMLPPKVRSMTYGEFCQDVADGLRTGNLLGRASYTAPVRGGSRIKLTRVTP